MGVVVQRQKQKLKLGDGRHGEPGQGPDELWWSGTHLHTHPYTDRARAQVLETHTLPWPLSPPMSSLTCLGWAGVWGERRGQGPSRIQQFQ